MAEPGNQREQRAVRERPFIPFFTVFDRVGRALNGTGRSPCHDFTRGTRDRRTSTVAVISMSTHDDGRSRGPPAERPGRSGGDPPRSPSTTHPDAASPREVTRETARRQIRARSPDRPRQRSSGDLPGWPPEHRSRPTRGYPDSAVYSIPDRPRVRAPQSDRRIGRLPSDPAIGRLTTVRDGPTAFDCTYNSGEADRGGVDGSRSWPRRSRGSRSRVYVTISPLSGRGRSRLDVDRTERKPGPRRGDHRAGRGGDRGVGWKWAVPASVGAISWMPDASVTRQFRLCPGGC